MPERWDMNINIEVNESSKIGLNSKESYIVIRNKTVFLRLLGDKNTHNSLHQYELMTATAAEDDNFIKACRNQVQLLAALEQLANELGIDAYNKGDRRGRPFIKIRGVTSNHGGDKETLRQELASCDEVKRFFEIYDEKLQQEKQQQEINELYDSCAIDDYGDDVYLSDGVWLSRDGTLHDN